MTKHSKNATANSCYTYYEKKKDAKQSGWGSKRIRLGKDSLKEFDACSLSLQPCRQPVVTRDGHLYDKQAVLEYILHQKQEISRRLKEYEKQQRADELATAERQRQEAEQRISDFVRLETLSHDRPEETKTPAKSHVYPQVSSGVAKPANKGKRKLAESDEVESVSNMSDGREKQLPSFWLPSQQPSSSETKLKKPDEKVRCPMSGKPIRMKDLVTVRFKPIPADDDTKNKSLITRESRYVCWVTNDVLSNSMDLCVIRPSGAVVTQSAVDKLIRKDMLDPLDGTPLTEKDIIPLKRGACGHAGSGTQLVAELKGVAMPHA